ncbi:hypothetical protein D0784_22475 [Vibrio campbellii]|uniref:hypothetical protein n=1 Tax=Vibrio campbellii TaxID=680 RepID=UPI000EFC1F66|nr:hypothetical protein [Vibrio campbellii]AYO12077.1 hypothetical protein D0784_22475 [Vibrio campbellii]
MPKKIVDEAHCCLNDLLLFKQTIVEFRPQKKPFPTGKGFDLVPKIFAVLQQFHRLLSDNPLFIGWVSISIAPTNRDLDRNELLHLLI